MEGSAARKDRGLAHLARSPLVQLLGRWYSSYLCSTVRFVRREWGGCEDLDEVTRA